MNRLFRVDTSDGFEESWLVGLFETREEADRVAAICLQAEQEYRAALSCDESEFVWNGSVSVSEIEVGKWEKPHSDEDLAQIKRWVLERTKKATE
jgi:hypothetical protein